MVHLGSRFSLAVVGIDVLTAHADGMGVLERQARMLCAGY